MPDIPSPTPPLTAPLTPQSTPGQSAGRGSDRIHADRRSAAPDSSSLSTQSSALSTPPSLSHQQHVLALALTSQSPAPPGFDPTRLSLAATTLLSKRLSSAAKSWPPLVHRLGPSFHPLFTTYAQSHPLPPGSTPADDAFHFAQHLASLNQLPLPALCLLSRAELHRNRRLISTRRTSHPPGLLLSLCLPYLPPITLHLRLPLMPSLNPNNSRFSP